MYSTLCIVSALFSIAVTALPQVSSQVSSMPPQNTAPPPPPLPTNALSGASCFAGELSNVRFSRDAAMSMIQNVCNDLIKKSVTFSADGTRHLPSGTPFDNDARKQGSDIANSSAVLFVHPDFMAGACPGPIDQKTGQAAPMTIDFGKVSQEDCMAPFIKAMDDCGDFTDAAGKFWKWGGSVNKNCITYTVDANVDTQLAPGPGY